MAAPNTPPGVSGLESYFQDPEYVVEDDRPDDCRCWDPDADLPCWPCYRAGFDAPNSDTPATE